MYKTVVQTPFYMVATFSKLSNIVLWLQTKVVNHSILLAEIAMFQKQTCNHQKSLNKCKDDHIKNNLNYLQVQKNTIFNPQLLNLFNKLFLWC